MIILDRFLASGTLAKFAFIVKLVSLLLTWIAFTCTGWGGINRQTEPYKRDGVYIGLWRKCSDDKYSSSCSQLDGWGLEWFTAFQAFVTLGFVGINLSAGLVIMYIFVASFKSNSDTGKMAALSSICSAGLFSIGVIIFAVRYKRDYIDGSDRDFVFGYCFFISIISILLTGSAGVFMFLDSRQSGGEPQSHQQSHQQLQQLQQQPPPLHQSNPTYGTTLQTCIPQPFLVASASGQQKPVPGQASTTNTPDDPGSPDRPDV